jgi:hypothetical protein
MIRSLINLPGPDIVEDVILSMGLSATADLLSDEAGDLRRAPAIVEMSMHCAKRVRDFDRDSWSDKHAVFHYEVEIRIENVATESQVRQLLLGLSTVFNDVVKSYGTARQSMYTFHFKVHHGLNRYVLAGTDQKEKNMIIGWPTTQLSSRTNFRKAGFLADSCEGVESYIRLGAVLAFCERYETEGYSCVVCMVPETPRIFSDRILEKHLHVSLHETMLRSIANTVLAVFPAVYHLGVYHVNQDDVRRGVIRPS